MSFLFPLYLLGGLAVTLPILLHLIRKQPRQRVVFSSLMFLKEVPPQTTRRSQIQNWLLLCLRALALILLTLGFSRPFLRNAELLEEDAENGRQLAILIDTSASLQREGLWKQVTDAVQKQVADFQPSDRVAVFAFDRDVRPVLSFSESAGLEASARTEILSERLKTLKPTWKGTHLGPALRDVLAACAEDATGHAARFDSRRILLVSDLQQGSRWEHVDAFAWPDDLRLELVRVKTDAPNNAGLHLVQVDPDTTALNNKDIRVRIDNAADSKRERFRLSWKARASSTVSSARAEIPVYVPAGSRRIVSVPFPNEQPAIGEQSSPAEPDTLLLLGDDHEFDNALQLTPRTPEEVRIAGQGVTTANDPSMLNYFLVRAFPDTPARHVEFAELEQSVFVEGQSPRLIVVDSPFDATLIPAMAGWLKRGGTLIYVLHAGETVSQVAELAGVLDVPVNEAVLDGYALLTEIDFSHRLFAPFAQPQFSDFSGIRFWKHRELDITSWSTARTVARFDDDAPAIIELPVESGKIWLFTAGWEPAESQWALSSKFAPMLHRGLEQPDETDRFLHPYETGDKVLLPELASPTNAYGVMLPDQNTLELAAGVREFSGTDLPGSYILTGPAGVTQRFAVRLPPEETQTAPLPLEELERRGILLGDAVTPAGQAAQAEHERQLRVQELETRQRVWRWLILAALVVLMIETWLAGRQSRNVPQGNSL